MAILKVEEIAIDGFGEGRTVVEVDAWRISLVVTRNQAGALINGRALLNFTNTAAIQYRVGGMIVNGQPVNVRHTFVVQLPAIPAVSGLIIIERYEP